MEATYGLTGAVHYGRGWPVLKRLANPAAGAAAKYLVPGGRVQRLVAVRATLKASAAEVTRTPLLRLLDGDGGVFAAFGPAGEVKKGGEGSFTWAAGIGYLGTILADESQVSIPDMLLPAGFGAEVAVGAIDKEDQLSALSLYLEEWPDGPDGYITGVRPSLQTALNQVTG